MAVATPATHLDTDTLLPLARRATGLPRVTLGDWQAEPIQGTSTEADTWRVSGTLWSIERFGLAAYHPGRFNGAYPDEPSRTLHGHGRCHPIHGWAVASCASGSAFVRGRGSATPLWPRQ